MTIVTLQRRLREVGRLRIGEKVAMSGGKSRPKKLDTFRFTSKDQAVIEAAAARYGGKVEPFEEPLSDDRWQVTTKADSLAIVIPPGASAFSQYLELWSRGGCQRRCDGETELISDKPCLCAEEHPDPKDYPCKPHTRLSVMLQELPGLGVWRLDSQGWYAATELAGAVDVCAAATARGQMLPARLRLEQRSVKRPGKDGKPQTHRFVVPVLDVDVTVAGLLAALSPGQPTALQGQAVAALEAGADFTPVDTDSMPEPPSPPIAEQVAAVNEDRPKQKRSNSQAPMPGSGRSRRKAPAVEAKVASDIAPATQAQVRKLNTMLGKVDVTGDDRHDYASGKLGREITSLKELSKAEANRMIDELEADESGGEGTRAPVGAPSPPSPPEPTDEGQAAFDVAPKDCKDHDFQKGPNPRFKVCSKCGHGEKA